jgi:hypothetical protein
MKLRPRDPEAEEAIASALAYHGVDRAEAEAFIEDHGASRAWVWLRTCKQCRGRFPEALHCGEDRKR